MNLFSVFARSWPGKAPTVMNGCRVVHAVVLPRDEKRRIGKEHILAIVYMGAIDKPFTVWHGYNLTSDSADQWQIDRIDDAHHRATYEEAMHEFGRRLMEMFPLPQTVDAAAGGVA
jgi:hypothetical protein